jgi:hypothetical protein
MTVREFASQNGYRVVTADSAAMDRTVTGVYACDLLSWAMVKVNAGDVWTTVHTNLNVVAVASLTQAACVVIPESIPIEASTVERANREGVPMLSASHGAAEVSVRAHRAVFGDVGPA